MYHTEFRNPSKIQASQEILTDGQHPLKLPVSVRGSCWDLILLMIDHHDDHLIYTN